MLAPGTGTAGPRQEAPNTMHQIIKLTPSYDRVEDRLQMLVQTKAGAVLAFWLTQRLASQVVLAMAKWLEDEVKGMSAGRNDPQLHAFEQGAAMARHQVQPPVSPQLAKACGLVDRVDLSRNGQRYMLNVVARSGESARMHAGAAEARQLLAIIQRMYRSAGWNTAHWPRWLAETAAAPNPDPAARSALH